MELKTAKRQRRGSRAVDLKTLLDANPMAGKRTRRFWTNAEERKLKYYFPKFGGPHCLKVLKGRSLSAIYNRANLLNLKAPATELASKEGRPRQKWTSSPSIDHAIKQGYPECTKRRDVARLAMRLNRPSWWVSKRASILGLASPRFKELPWTQPEIDLITTYAHLSSAALSRRLKAAGTPRSPTAVTVKLKRLHTSREDPTHYTAWGFAKLLGIDGSTVTSWIERGLLRARRRGTARTAQQGGDQWWIKHKDAFAFIRENAARIDVRKVDKVWFIEFLATRGHAVAI